VRLELLRFYRTFAGSNILHPLLKAQEGKVIKLLDDNFGVLETSKEPAINIVQMPTAIPKPDKFLIAVSNP
jgi:hypothetical protein